MISFSRHVPAIDREDQNITNFARNACAALIGWVETDPGSCTLGGPLCCTKKPSHWGRDPTAWVRFTAENATKNETIGTKTVQSNASTTIDESTLIDRNVFNGNSTSLDDVVSDLTQLLVKKTTDSIANKDNLTMKGYRQSAAWIKMRDKAYQQFLAEVEKDPELKKKGSKTVTLPTGELIRFETPEAKFRRRRGTGSREAVIGKRG